MRRLETCVGLLVVAAVSGCAGDRAERHGCSLMAWAADQSIPKTSSLLFDRVPASTLQPGMRPITAEDFACRSEWPSTSGFRYAGEVVVYRAWNWDHQYGGSVPYSSQNYHAESYRTGIGFR